MAGNDQRLGKCAMIINNYASSQFDPHRKSEFKLMMSIGTSEKSIVMDQGDVFCNLLCSPHCEFWTHRLMVTYCYHC